MTDPTDVAAGMRITREWTRTLPKMLDDIGIKTIKQRRAYIEYVRLMARGYDCEARLVEARLFGNAEAVRRALEIYEAMAHIQAAFLKSAKGLLPELFKWAPRHLISAPEVHGG